MIAVFKENDVRLVSGGSDNHLVLVDVKKSFAISGKKAEKVLDEVCITCNKNSIPFDPEKPLVTSGIRLGSPAMTTRGFKEDDFRKTAEWIIAVLRQPDDQSLKECVKQEVLALTKQYPVR